MDSEKCRVLLTVLHERSLSAAAEVLGYTPSGISRLVDSLERETGFPLLHRGRGGVSATRACQELLPLMRRMAELDEQYQQLAHRIQGLDVGRVVAGTNYAAFYPWLSEVIAGFHHAYPGIRVELREGSSTQLGELVDHRRADFCLISQRPGRHKWVPLKDDQLMAILPPTHPLVEADRFPVERLRQEPFIEFLPGQETDNSRMLQQLQIRPKIRFATSDSRAAIAHAGCAPCVASLTTINTPHRGCIFAEYLLKKIPAAARQKIADTYNAALKRLGDEAPDFLAAVTDLTASACEARNAATPDAPGVFYQSVMSYCRKAQHGKFPLNMTYPIVKHFVGLNDGLVAVDSAKWGDQFTLLEPRGHRGISHGDVVDLNRENIPGFDVREFYVSLVADLKNRGF